MEMTKSFQMGKRERKNKDKYKKKHKCIQGTNWNCILFRGHLISHQVPKSNKKSKAIHLLAFIASGSAKGKL